MQEKRKERNSFSHAISPQQAELLMRNSVLWFIPNRDANGDTFTAIGINGLQLYHPYIVLQVVNLTSDMVELAEPDGNDPSFWSAVMMELLVKKDKESDGLYYSHLLWSLSHLEWEPDVLRRAIENIDVRVRHVIIREIGNVAVCLSVVKQDKVAKLFSLFRESYRSYNPGFVKELSRGGDNQSLFDKVDAIMSEGPACSRIENPIWQVWNWLGTDNVSALPDYDMLRKVYVLLSPESRTRIVKRYLHDVRLKNTTLDIQLLEFFADIRSPLHRFINYRYAIYSLHQQRKVGASLLADCVLSLIRTHGEEFQSYDGLLDFLLRNADPSSPSVDIELTVLYPQCYGPVMINDKFSGFVKVEVECGIDEEKINKLRSLISEFEESQKQRMQDLLHRLDKKKDKYKRGLEIVSQYQATEDEETKRILVQWRKWLELYDQQRKDYAALDIQKSKYDKYKILLDNLPKYKKGDDTYIVPFQDCMEDVEDVYEKRNLIIKINDFTYSKLERVPSTIKKEESFLNGNRGIGNEICNSIRQELEHDLNCKAVKDEWKVPYSLQHVRLLISKYHITDGDSDEIFEKRTPLKMPCFDRPYAKHPLLGLPFWTCIGKQCFQSKYTKQRLAETDSYGEYTLFHLAEILGFSMLEEEDGLVRSGRVSREFISMANRQRKKFDQLKCRNCGHLMLPMVTDQKVSYNKFHCINPNCLEYNRNYYINHCFTCGKGIIDERDCNQCPNGWRICPNCLSCCSNAVFDRLAKPYMIQSKPLPNYLERCIGRGHRENGEYFCWKCGCMLGKTDTPSFECPNCHTILNNPWTYRSINTQTNE